MNRENETVPNLKRRLTFLRTIDQKLEGIRRENERLQRIAANPRVVFSRSSLAGLYRIVNSLASAGPMYGLPEIEKWAVTSRDWLVALGRRGTGPSEAELERLMTAAGELGRLRDEAMTEVEQLLKETPATVGTEANPPPAEEASVEDVDTGTTAAEKKPVAEADAKADAKSDGFPFTDEPKARTIKESEFAPKGGKKGRSPRPEPQPGRFRDRTSTIPLAIDDINMLGTTSMIPPKAESKSGPGVFWKIFALLSFAGFAVMTALYVNEKSNAAASPPSVSDCAPATVAPVPVPPPVPVDTASDTAPSDTAGLSADAPQDAPAPAKGSSEIDAKRAAGSKSDGKKAEDNDKERRRSRTKSKDNDRKSDSKSEKTAAADPASAQGILFVKAPADGSDVFVLVDGVSKGKAPIRTKLPPGLHEVVFTAEGKRSMRMVPVKADETKTVVATPPN